jgi:2-polyprenyl-3-methyl-5-hydroxy-6-metoxy-1,4-benzoquinol methylase
MSTLPAGAGTGIEGIEQIRRANFASILDCLATHRTLKGARVLEVGCADGLFLDAAAQRGASVHAIEPELAKARIARAKGHTVEEGFFPDDLAATAAYDVIAFNDVFEHLPRPVEALRAVERLLAPGGIAVLNLPTSSGFLYKTATLLDHVGFDTPFNRLWQKGLPSPHVSYFNESNLRRLATAHTRLTMIDQVRLSSIKREGLHARVTSVNKGATAELLFAGAWAFSFVADVLPSDIMALLFQRQLGPAEDRSSENTKRRETT